MFSLLLLAGILLALGGPDCGVHGITKLDPAAELNTEQLIDQIIRYQRQLLREQKRRENQERILEEEQQYGNIAVPDELENPELEKVDLDVKEDKPVNTGIDDKVTSTEPAVAHKPPEALAQTNYGKPEADTDGSDMFLKIIVITCTSVGLVGLIMAGVCWYKLQSRVKAASDVEYPAYGVTGPTKERLPSPGDRKLAQSAQMYHYQHQKQQMIAMEKANGEMKQDASEDESEEENEEGDYTVYECPGLAPTGEMEVRNPLFTEDSQTPVNGQPPTVNGLAEDNATE